MPAPELTVYGAYWCPDCRRAKKFLGENFIPFNWVDIEQDRAAEALVLHKNQGKRIIPMIVFADGSFLVEPTNARLAEKLGLKTKAAKKYYDVIIAGAGPAGLTAAIYAAREGLDTLVVERSGIGGQVGITTLDNFPGFPEGIPGQEFADRAAQQARRFGVEFLQAQEISYLENEENYRVVQLDGGEHYHAPALLLATGASYRRLEVPGEDEYIGAGVHFCATCDGPFYKGAKQLVVIGGGNSATEEALQLTRFADRVTMLVRGEALKASQIAIDKIGSPHSRVEVLFRTRVEAFEGADSRLKSVKYRSLQTGESGELFPAAAFIFIGQQPNSAFARGMVALDESGFILTGRDLEPGRNWMETRQPFAFETSWPGVFAAGDVRKGSTKQVAAAVGEGAAAVIALRDYLRLV
jgi:thioredoxin reductase (NADPH)